METAIAPKNTFSESVKVGHQIYDIVSWRWEPDHSRICVSYKNKQEIIKCYAPDSNIKNIRYAVIENIKSNL